MPDTTLLLDGVRVPRFLYGTAWKEDPTQRLSEVALQQGFRGIDTANQRRHYFEAGVGQALAQAYSEGIVTRADLFLQTKFTYAMGQDQRLPYDPSAPLRVQVEQSIASSLEHLGAEHLDSYILHGPASGYSWGEADVEVWEAMVRARDAGHLRLLGVSNISRRQLEQMISRHGEAPAFVQNRCYARMGWDRDVREFCLEHQIVYQGFSLLTANLGVLKHPLVVAIAATAHVTPSQVVFAFCRALGILPLTGTTSEAHMREDLASLKLNLPPEAVQEIEQLAG